jgi:uncharacterized membrane protein YkvA (DUF1232 family)
LIKFSDEQLREQRDADAKLKRYSNSNRGRNPHPENEASDSQVIIVTKDSINQLVYQIAQWWNSLTTMLHGQLSSSTILTWIAIIIVLIYVISPLDFFPDFMALPFSVLDDLLLVLWLFYFLKDVVQKFQQTEAERALRQQMQGRAQQQPNRRRNNT